MSVVKRCPNCGTTQDAAGECEACHEADVRYFCLNHEPGLWLAGRTCPQCAARAAPSARPAPPTSAPPPYARPAALRPDASRAGRSHLRPVDDAGPDLHPVPVPRAAPREPASLAERGWLPQLVRRLALIALLLVVALGVAIYMVARSVH